LRVVVPRGQLTGLSVFGATETTSWADAYVQEQVFTLTPWTVCDPAVPYSGVSAVAPKAAFTAPGVTAEHGSSNPRCCLAAADETTSRTTPTKTTRDAVDRRRRGVAAVIRPGL
jgi:hypothetical protein